MSVQYREIQTKKGIEFDDENSSGKSGLFEQLDRIVVAFFF